MFLLVKKMTVKTSLGKEHCNLYKLLFVNLFNKNFITAAKVRILELGKHEGEIYCGGQDLNEKSFLRRIFGVG